MKNTNVKLIDKPILFEKSPFEILGLIAELLLPLLGNKFFKWYHYIIIYCIIILITIIYYFIKYYLKIEKFYKVYKKQLLNIADNRDSIKKDNDNLVKKLNNAKECIKSRDLVILDVITFLNNISLEPNDYEKKCINNLLNNILTKTKSINDMEMINYGKRNF